MNSHSNAMPEPHVESQVGARAAISWPRHFYWSVRRELWEYRSLYIAPLIVAGVFLFGFLISTTHRSAGMRGMPAPGAPSPEVAHAAGHSMFALSPYNSVALLIMAVTFLVAVFYCLEALHGERRDRSILFWKSLPVSDFTTVVSKAAIPLVILPLLTFAITTATQLIMLLLQGGVLLAKSETLAAPGMQWSFQMSLVLLYHLVTVHALWYAPIYGWLLLVSSWARRAAFLWAFLPPLAIGFGEKIAFNTSHFAGLLGHRMNGPEAVSFTEAGTMDPLMQIHLGQFLGTPGLWLGLAFAAICLAIAMRLRRYREPI